MKHHIVILSLLLYLGGMTLAHAAQVFCPSDSSTVSVLFAEEDGKKKDGEEPNPEDECE
ncbi:MAG: hypothetical protein OEU74_09865 [Gammaproteobacteria bacterium]|nr:hypothetical protein [Gammaproteobacteria bacterium]